MGEHFLQLSSSFFASNKKHFGWSRWRKRWSSHWPLSRCRSLCRLTHDWKLFPDDFQRHPKSKALCHSTRNSTEKAGFNFIGCRIDPISSYAFKNHDQCCTIIGELCWLWLTNQLCVLDWINPVLYILVKFECDEKLLERTPDYSDVLHGLHETYTTNSMMTLIANLWWVIAKKYKKVLTCFVVGSHANGALKLRYEGTK